MALKWHRNWLLGIVPTATALGLTTGTLFTIAHRMVNELTRPGMALSDDALVWGGWHFPHDDPEPPAVLQRSLTFAAPGGPRLQGDFWVQPQPAPTIILSHGFRVPRVKMRAVAALEYRHGSNVLLFDYRGHGDSADAVVSGGTAEVHDLAAAVDCAVRQPETQPGNIFIHGFSMGAAVALLLPPRPEIAGIIADSPYAHLDEMLERIISMQVSAMLQGGPRIVRGLRRLAPAISRVVLPGGRLLFRLRFRYDLIARPERAIHRWLKSRDVPPPVLLFHTRHDPLIPLRHAETIATAITTCGVPVRLVVMESDIHCGAYGHDPQTYMAEILQFVQAHRIP